MLVKSYFVFLSLAITTIFFDKAVQRCRIWQRWFIFITPFAATSLFFFRFLSFCLRLAPSFPFNSPPPPPFSLPSLFSPLPCFVSLRFFHCHIVLLQMQHTFCQWSLCSGWKPRRPCTAAARQQGTRVFSVSSCFWSSTDWFLSLLQKRLAHGSNKFSMSFWPVFNRSASARMEMGSNLMLSAQSSLSLFTKATDSPFAFLPLFPSLLLWFPSLCHVSFQSTTPA